jgi:hypothetical protein
MWLTAEEIERMTGTKTRPAQAAWLNEHNIPFTKSRRGELNVLRAAVARRHGSEGEPCGDSAPDFTVFEPGVHSRRHAAKTSV